MVDFGIDFTSLGFKFLEDSHCVRENDTAPELQPPFIRKGGESRGGGLDLGAAANRSSTVPTNPQAIVNPTGSA